jgi:outer membrane protein
MRDGSRLLILWALIPLFPMTTVSAASEQEAVLEASAFARFSEAERVHALIRLARDGRHDLAATLLTRYPLTGPFAANRTLFIEGLILKAEGHLPAAAQKYRSALASDPSLATVRAELAHTLYLLGDKAGAKQAFERLRASAPEEKQARNIAAVMAAIDSGKVVAIGTGFHTPPDLETVVVSGVTFEIDDGRESGIAFASGIDAAYSEALEHRLAAIVGWGAYTLQYEGLSQPGCVPRTDTSDACENYPVSEIAEMRYKTEAGYIGFSTLAQQSPDGRSYEKSDWLDLDEGSQSWALGPRFTLFHAIAPDLALASDVTLLHEDGWRTAAESTLARIFSGDLVGFASGGIERYDADGDDDRSYWSFFGSVGVVKELPWNVSARSEIGAKRRVYDSLLLDEPAAPRRDMELGTSLSLWKRDFNIWGYSPVVEYSFTWNGSNVGLFDYTSHTFDFRLTKEF